MMLERWCMLSMFLATTPQFWYGETIWNAGEKAGASRFFHFPTRKWGGLLTGGLFAPNAMWRPVLKLGSCSTCCVKLYYCKNFGARGS